MRSERRCGRPRCAALLPPPPPQPKQFRHPIRLGVAVRGCRLQNMLRRAVASALGGGARLFSSKSYPIVDHTFDAIVVGAGECFPGPVNNWVGQGWGLSNPALLVSCSSVQQPFICFCRWGRSARRGGPFRRRLQHCVSLQKCPAAAAACHRRRHSCFCTFACLHDACPSAWCTVAQYCCMFDTTLAGCARLPPLQVHHQAVPHAQPHGGSTGRHQCRAGEHDGCERDG